MYKMILFDKAVYERFKNIFTLGEIAKGLRMSRTLLEYKVKTDSRFSDIMQKRWYEFLKSQSELLTTKLHTINSELTSIEKYLEKK